MTYTEAEVDAACKAFLKSEDWESRWQTYRAIQFKFDMRAALEAAAKVRGANVAESSDALTPRQLEAVMDALDRVLAGDPDGQEIQMAVYQRAYDKIAEMGNRISATSEPQR